MLKTRANTSVRDVPLRKFIWLGMRGAAGSLLRSGAGAGRVVTAACRTASLEPGPQGFRAGGVNQVLTSAADRTAARIKAEVQAVLPDYTITVAPQQTPQIAVPLGWSLSKASRASLDDALTAYVNCSTTAPICPQGKEFSILRRMTAAGAD